MLTTDAVYDEDSGALISQITQIAESILEGVRDTTKTKV